MNDTCFSTLVTTLCEIDALISKLEGLGWEIDIDDDVMQQVDASLDYLKRARATIHSAAYDR